MKDYKQLFEPLKETYDELMSLVEEATLLDEIKTVEQKTYKEDFWDDQQTANKIMKKLKRLKNKQKQINQLKETFDNLKMSLELLEMDEDLKDEFEQSAAKFKKQAETLNQRLLLSNPNDTSDCVMEIHPGAGGTESQDWADMLLRMYQRYCEQEDFEFAFLDYQKGDEAGIKSVTISIKGDYAFGLLKAENGVHRLVRISPFDSGGRRHTSFASINVYPEVDDDVDIQLDEKDLKIDTYRSSGAGGQSVNTTDSAVRITHLPTKQVVTVQNERSQLKNKAQALKILKGKLYQLELERKQKEMDKYKATNQQNAFGSQIRSYVLHPYKMVKDHRTSIETGNVDKVLNGDLNMFINAYLTQKLTGDLS
ncbi:MAG: peptide chain release factor 2 [Candidatus Izimaplasma sp.]|nr:peptide chain release factor 2 [Candidatus Izimaplasma bacterium]